jgi:hypothetical protein
VARSRPPRICCQIDSKSANPPKSRRSRRWRSQSVPSDPHGSSRTVKSLTYGDIVQ